MGKATLKFVRVSPIKSRLVAREVQGMNAEVAIASLGFTPNKAAGIIAKVIASAVANSGLEPEEAIVELIEVQFLRDLLQELEEALLQSISQWLIFMLK